MARPCAFRRCRSACSRAISPMPSAVVGSSRMIIEAFGGERLGDLDQLLLGDRQLADRRVDVDRRIHLGEHARGRRAHRSPVDLPPRSRQPAEIDVLGDRQASARARIPGTPWRRPAARAALGSGSTTGAPLLQDRAAVGLVGARQHLDQRRLAASRSRRSGRGSRPRRRRSEHVVRRRTPGKRLVSPTTSQAGVPCDHRWLRRTWTARGGRSDAIGQYVFDGFG